MAAIDAAANLDANGAIRVNQPLTATQAGFSRLAALRGATAYFSETRITGDGELSVGVSARLFECAFNGASAGALFNNQWNQQATTLATALNGGFLRFNSAAVTTINTGVSINSWQTFVFTDHNTIRVSAPIRHSTGAGSLSNKTFEFGFGYYDVAANQAAAMNEFIGFRFGQSGLLQAVVEYSTGGAPVSITQVLTIQSDNVAHRYEIEVNNDFVAFMIDGEVVAVLAAQADSPGLLKSNTLPLIARLFNGASAPATAPVFDLGDVTVTQIGPGASALDFPAKQAMQGRHAIRAQAGIQAASGMTASVPASGTAPGALVPSNTVSGLVGLGGYGKATLTGVTATLHSELIMCSFQNPAIPETAGQATEARPLVITDLMISPLIVTTALTGGGFTAEWFIFWGGTALSLATADAIGGAAVGTKSHNKMPLPIMDTLAATAALGTIATRNGAAGHIPLQTPIVVNPGEFVGFGLRTLFVGAAVTAGGADAGFALNGYWL